MTRNAHGPLWRRLVGFLALPLLSTIAPLVLLPVIARIASTSEWVAIAVGQSVGGFAAIAVSYGWAMTGPVQVAGVDWAARKALYFDSLASRLIAFACVAPIAWALAAALTDSSVRALAISTALAGATGGLSPSWFAVGCGRPRDVALYETAPRLLAAAVSVGVVASGGPLVGYPVATICASMFAVIAYTVRMGRIAAQIRFTNLWRTARWQALAAATTLVAGTYTASAVTLVAVVATPRQSAMFASGTRLYQFMLLGLTAVSQALMVDTRMGSQSNRHRQRASRLYLLVGIAGLLTLGLFGPQLARGLFTPEFAIRPATAWPFALAYLAVTGNTYLGQQVLVPRGDNRLVLRDVSIGAAIGVPATLLLSDAFGATGGAWALATAEMMTWGAMYSSAKKPSSRGTDESHNLVARGRL